MNFLKENCSLHTNTSETQEKQSGMHKLTKSKSLSAAMTPQTGTDTKSRYSASNNAGFCLLVVSVRCEAQPPCAVLPSRTEVQKITSQNLAAKSAACAYF